MLKKFLSFFLVFISIFCFNINNTLALNNENAKSNIKWNYKQKSNCLVVYGDGKIDDFISYEETPWYKYCSKAKKIVVKNGITSIGKNAFSNFYNIEKVVLSPSVITIKKSAFSRCYSLKKINLKNVTSIGSGAFLCCYDLKKINILNAETIGKSAFSNCTSLKNITFGNKITVINKSVFEYCSLKKVVIPKNVKRIKSEAFSMSSNVQIYIYNTDVKLSRNFIGRLEYSSNKANLIHKNNYCLHSYEDSNTEKFAEKNEIRFKKII